MARPKTESVAERRERVSDLLLLHGMKPMEIAALLFAEGVLPSETIEAAHRLIRSDVEAVRKELSVDDVLALKDSGEARIFTRRMEYVLRHAAEELEKRESVSTSRTKMFKNGKESGPEIVVAKKVDRAGIRQRWAEKYMQAAKAIAAVNGVAIEASRKKSDDHPDPDRPDDDAEPFVFNFPNVTGSDKDLDAMLAMNLAHHKVN